MNTLLTHRTRYKLPRLALTLCIAIAGAFGAKAADSPTAVYSTLLLNGQALSNVIVQLVPISLSTLSNSIVAPFTYSNVTRYDGTLTITNIVPQSYRVTMRYAQGIASFTNCFTGLTGSVYASDYICGATPTNNLIAYSQAQADARFALRTNALVRVFTNGIGLGLGLTNVDFVAGVTGYVSGGSARLGVSSAGSSYDGSAVSNRLVAAEVTNAAQTVRLDATDSTNAVQQTALAGLTNAVLGKQTGSFVLSNFLAMGISNIVTVTGTAEGIGTNGGVLYITNVLYAPYAATTAGSNAIPATNGTGYSTTFAQQTGSTASPWQVLGTNGLTTMWVRTNTAAGASVVAIGTNLSSALVISNFNGMSYLIASNAAPAITINGGNNAVALAGNLTFTDNTYDIGANNTTRPKDYYGAGKVRVEGTLQTSAGGGTGVQQSSPSEGVLLYRDFNGSSFNRLQFGGTTAARGAIGSTNGDLVVFGSDGLFAGGSTNRLIVQGAILGNGSGVTNIIYPSTFIAPNQLAQQGGQWWSDGTNMLFVLQNAAGTRTTNKVTFTAWP